MAHMSKWTANTDTDAGLCAVPVCRAPATARVLVKVREDDDEPYLFEVFTPALLVSVCAEHHAEWRGSRAEQTAAAWLANRYGPGWDKGVSHPEQDEKWNEAYDAIGYPEGVGDVSR
jgi:hypothetical protein